VLDSGGRIAGESDACSISAIATPTTTTLKDAIGQKPIGLLSMVQVQPRLVALPELSPLDAPDRQQAENPEDGRDDGRRRRRGLKFILAYEHILTKVC
jgi:hypothetical protein